MKYMKNELMGDAAFSTAVNDMDQSQRSLLFLSLILADTDGDQIFTHAA